MIYVKLILVVIFVFIGSINQAKSIPLGKDFYFNSKGDLILNQIKKTITSSSFFFINNKNKYSADEITIWYQDLNTLDLEHINRIDANNNIKIVTPSCSISSDKYKYSLVEQVHILIADKKPIIYKDSLHTLVAHDRIEYFINKNIVVIRGTPKLIGKESECSVNQYFFSSDIINIHLTPADKNQNKKTDIEYAEAIKNVYFKDGDTSIKADYAIYYKKQNQLEFYDNIVFSNKESKLKGHAAIYNLTLGYGKIISKNKNSTVTGVYKSTSKNKNEPK